MNTLKRLNNLLLRGHITIEEYESMSKRYEVEQSIKTAEEIITYLETEVSKAFEMYQQAKGKDAQQAFESMYRVATLEQILEDIKQ